MTHASNAHYQALKAKIENKTAVVGIMGLGYVGLPLLTAFHDAGCPVIGYDIDPEKIVLIKKGENYLPHLGDDLLKGRMQSKTKFDVTSDLSRLGEADAILVCVPTPLGTHMEPDLSYIITTAEAIGKTLRPGQLIVLESSTYPGTTRDDMLPAMLKTSTKKLKSGEDFFVAFSPEREDPGRKSHNTKTIPKLVGGLDEPSTDLACALYKHGIETVVRTSSAEVAETAKLLENIFRCVNIAMVNELKVVLDAMNINVWEVIEAASTKPFGFMPFYPGPGLGGHCIPIDPFYLTWKAKEVGKTARFIELAGEVNTSMPHYVVHKVAENLNNQGKAVKGSKVLVLGLAYKPDIADTRESPSFELLELLHTMGADAQYSDPYLARTTKVRKYDLKLESVALTPENIAKFDCVLVSTNHSSFDYGMIAKHAKLVVDTRNAMKKYAGEMGKRLARA